MLLLLWAIQCCVSVADPNPVRPGDINYLPDQLLETVFSGSYQSLQQEVRVRLAQRLFDYLDSKVGNLHLFLYEEEGSVTVYLSIYDPLYHDLNAVQVSCDLSNFTGNKYPGHYAAPGPWTRKCRSSPSTMRPSCQTPLAWPTSSSVSNRPRRRMVT